jgi:hypothetical protein
LSEAGGEETGGEEESGEAHCRDQCNVSRWSEMGGAVAPSRDADLSAMKLREDEATGIIWRGYR